MKVLSKEQFGYDVSTIGGYVDEVGGELLAKALIGGTTQKYINVRTGIKGSQSVNLLNSSASFQNGSCGWNPSGTTTFSQINIVTCDYKYNEAMCYKDLYETYQSMLMKPGQISETVPFQEQILDLKVKEIEQFVERQIWQATTGSTCFNGYKALFVTGNTYVASSSGTSFSSTAAYGVSGNPITEVDKLINVLDSNVQNRSDLVVFMSYPNYRLYVQAMTRANFFANYIGSSNSIGGPNSLEITHPNASVKVVPTIGLESSNQVVIAPGEFMVMGTDLLSSDQKVKAWYSVDNDEIRFRANFNFGVTLPGFGSLKYFATNGLA